MNTIKAILLMGGTGLRFGSSTPKQFHRLAGKKIYQHTLEQLLKISDFHEILLVCPESDLKTVEQETLIYDDPRIRLVLGGGSRQESSYLGLLACGEETTYVVIHDAVRPFVSREVLLNNIQMAIKHGAVDTCIPSADTIVHSRDASQITEIPKRSEYFRGQTPQSFLYPLILQAHLSARQENLCHVSDDCSLLTRLNHPVYIVQGSEENIKITHALDLILAEQILRLQKQVSIPAATCQLKGKRFAITGGTGEIGQALVHLLQEEGAIALPISRSSSLYSADLTESRSVEQIFATIHQEQGMLHGLINCMGELKMGELSHLTPEEIQSQIATNLTGIIYCCKYAHIMKSGHIVNLSSSSYIRGKKGYAIYSSAKAAIVNFTQGLAEERRDLLTNAVVPQRTNTAMRRQNFPQEDPATLIDPKEVAKAIVALLKQQELTAGIIEVRKDLSRI